LKDTRLPIFISGSSSVPCGSSDSSGGFVDSLYETSKEIGRIVNYINQQQLNKCLFCNSVLFSSALCNFIWKYAL
jgi:hypothetical protein